MKNPEKLTVCERCLMAIESREGEQVTRRIYIDEDDENAACDWCGEDCFSILYEIQ